MLGKFGPASGACGSARHHRISSGCRPVGCGANPFSTRDSGPVLHAPKPQPNKAPPVCAGNRVTLESHTPPPAAAPAGIIPSDPALLAKARLWADLWGAYVGPAQARCSFSPQSPLHVTHSKRPALPLGSPLLRLAVQRWVHPALLRPLLLTGPVVPAVPCCAVPAAQTAILQADTKAKVAEATGKMAAALKVGQGLARSAAAHRWRAQLGTCVFPALCSRLPTPEQSTVAAPQVMDGFLRSQGSSEGGSFVLGGRYSIAEVSVQRGRGGLGMI